MSRAFSPGIFSSRYLPFMIGGAVLGVVAAVPVGATLSFLYPMRRFNRTNPKVALGFSYERVRFRSADGTSIRAWYVPSPEPDLPRGLVIICHGYTGNRATMLPYLSFLHRAGYAALLPEFRAHGWSGGGRTSFGIGESLDLLAAIDWVRKNDDLRDLPLILFGESMGASVVLLVAAEEEGIAAVIVDSPYARFDTAVLGRFTSFFGDTIGPKVAPPIRRIGEKILGINCEEIAPEAVVARIAPRPILLIQGLSDRLILPENARRIYAASPDNITLWEVEGASHVASIYIARDEYIRRVTEFLESALDAK